MCIFQQMQGPLPGCQASAHPLCSGPSPTLQRLARLPMRRLVPRGFVFIWVPKQHVQAVCRQVLRGRVAKCCAVFGQCCAPCYACPEDVVGYIEHLIWVLLRPSSHTAATKQSTATAPSDAGLGLLLHREPDLGAAAAQ